MHKSLLHVLFSPSGAGTLRQTLAQQARSDQVICPFDDFSFGPIGSDDAERVKWVSEELGVDGWESVVADTTPFLEASCSGDVMPVAWFSRRDAKSYAGFLWWLSHLRDAPCSIVDVTELVVADPVSPSSSTRLAISPSALVPYEMARLLGSEVKLGEAVREGHRARWEQLVAENAPLRVVDVNGSLRSAPITYFDPLLLACATTSWQKMARIVGEALGSFWLDGVSQAGDLLLVGRARILAEAGLLEWRGDLSLIQACELRLPVFPIE